MRIEMTILQNCDAECPDCNRAVGVVRFPGYKMTPDQVRRGMEQLREQGETARRLTICGGEPAMHPEIQAILDEAGKGPGLRNGRMLSNGLNIENKKERIKLPERFKWVVAPLDDPKDRKSGKVKHFPFFVSPKDLGMEHKSSFENCTVKGYCGKGLDANGWSACGVAGVLGRFLGINPYSMDGPVLEEPKGICEHCPYSMTRKDQYALYKDINENNKPRVTETYRAGIKAFRDNPFNFPTY